MARCKTLRHRTTFEIFPISSCTLCLQKSYISKGIQRIFEIFATARGCWGRAFWWKISSAQVFHFCNCKVKTFAHVQHLKFPTFNLYTVPVKMLYLLWYSTDFRNLCLSTKILLAGSWVESFRRADMVLLQWQGENFAHRQHLKFSHFHPVHCARKILYLQRYSTDFRKLCHNSKNLRVGFWVESFNRADILLLQWQGENFAHVQHLKFPTLNLYTVTAKILYLQRYSTDLRNLCLSSKMLRVGNLVENFRRAPVLHLQWQAEIVAYQQHLKFCHVNLYTIAAQILYLQRYSSDFRNLCHSSNILRVGIWVESFKRAGILLLQWKVKTLRIDNIWNFATFNLYTVPEKILYLQRYSTDFRNLCLSSKMLREGIWAERFRRAAILLSQWPGENFAHLQHLKFPTFNLYTVPAKILYLQRYSTDFRNISSARRLWGWTFEWKVWSAQVFYFCNGKWKLCASTTFEISHFQSVHCHGKNPISPKVFNPFSISLPPLEDVEGGHLGGKIQARRCFTFAMARWKLCASTKFEISHLQPVHCGTAKILYLQR